MAQVLTPELTSFFQNRKQSELNQDLATAAYNGEFEILRYLLTSPELTIHADILYNESVAFQIACERNRRGLVEYMLTSPELTQHANIHGENDNAYKYSCQKENIPMVVYLLSFNAEQCISFQETDFDMHWAINNKYNDVIQAMMINLYLNNMLEYLSVIEIIKKYDAVLLETIIKELPCQTINLHSEIDIVL